jgi:hypothetical protein
VAVPTLLNGSECWTLTKQQFQQIESSENEIPEVSGGLQKNR